MNASLGFIGVEGVLLLGDIIEVGLNFVELLEIGVNFEYPLELRVLKAITQNKALNYIYFNSPQFLPDDMHAHRNYTLKFHLIIYLQLKSIEKLTSFLLFMPL